MGRIFKKEKSSDFAQKDRRSYMLMIGPPFLIMLLLTVVPIGYTIVQSLWKLNYAMPGQERFIGLKNYVKMFTDDPFFWTIMGNTFIIAFATVALQMVLGMAMALLLSRETRLVRMARSLVMLPIMTTPVVVGVLWRFIVNPDFGLINYLLSLIGIKGPNWLGDPVMAKITVILSDLWLSTPFVMVILVAGIAALPKDVYEAAKVDGASSTKAFMKITLPLLKPVILVALMFRLIDAFKRFDSIFIMTAGGPGNATETLNLYAYSTGFSFMDMGYASALTSFLFVIISVVVVYTVSVMNRTSDY